MGRLLKKSIKEEERGINMLKFLVNLLWFITALVMYPLFVSSGVFHEKNPFTRPNQILSESFNLLFR
jgi:hypothetical protein